MTTELGIGSRTFSTSMAVANLMWASARWRPAWLLIATEPAASWSVVTLATMAGLYVMYSATTASIDGQRACCSHRRERHRHYRARGAPQAVRAARPADGSYCPLGHGPAASAASLLSLHACADEPVGCRQSLLYLTITMALVLPLAWG